MKRVPSRVAIPVLAAGVIAIPAAYVYVSPLLGGAIFGLCAFILKRYEV